MPSSRQISPLRYAEPILEDVISPVDPAGHPALAPGRVAVITGAASGIGLSAAKELAAKGLRVVLADVDDEALASAGKQVAKIAGTDSVLLVKTDVSKLEDVQRLKERAYDAFGEVSVLLNNAGIGPRGSSFGQMEEWKRIMDVNLWGVINVQQVFAPAMIYQENASVIITTGSKQGITNPPGNAAYNASKAAVKSITESLANELRATADSHVTAHLFIPGWTFTGMTGKGTLEEKPPGAWTAQQTVQYMLDRVQRGDFYIVCPDNETSPELDRLRMQWANADITENRPALSRWHPEWKPRFEEFVKEGLESHRERRSLSRQPRSQLVVGANGSTNGTNGIKRSP